MKTMKRFSTLFAILLILSISTYVGDIQNAVANEADWMPDANLRAAVRSALNLGNNDALTQAGMASLTRLTARNAQISNLTGLEHATNLEKLDLRDNTINNISALSGLTNLESLKLKGNDISSVSGLSGLTNLTLLNLKENNISSISTLSGLANLEHLRVDQNSITDVQPLTSLVNLERLWIAGNSLTNAHLLSSLTGLTQIDIPIPDPPDTTAPRVSISAPSGVQNGAFDATITFSETVSGFTQSDVSLRGSAASITSWRANSGNTVYTATITPTASGTVTVGVAANVATDAAGNQNTAATSKTVTVSVDMTSPSVTVSVPSGVQNGAFSVTITFTEAVSDFVQSEEVSLSGSAASITSWSANSGNTVYTATITPTASGTVTIGVAANVATDAANNPNTAATSKRVTVDVDKPSVSISVPSGTQTSAFNATITFSETVSGFTQSDVSLSGSVASITSWRTNSGNTVYTATITPTASGTVTIGVAANVATDAAGNQNTAATSKNVTVSVDTTSPGVTVSVPSSVQNGAFNATITFTEPVSGFTQSEVSLSGSAASITAWRANSGNTVYTATITPTASGTVTIGVAANVATDVANNQNTAATSKTVTVSVDTTAPGVSISVLSGVQNGAFNATITFTEAVSGFTESEVSLSGSAASITGWRANSGNTVYTATITPTASGTVTIGVDANVATDAANNQNTAATSKTVSVDVDRPSVSIGAPSGTQTGAFDATITFLETVSGFVGSEVSLSGSAASITGWRANSGNTVYTATITPTASGTVTIGVAANVATDAANNSNTAATSKTVTVNIPDPIPDPATWMPDANLRTAVRSALSLGNNDTLTQAGMANLTRLTARNAQISSLTGLEHATNLTSLDLRDNTIGNISALSGLTNLESLKLKGNDISSVSALSGLTNLTLLNLKENNISSISGLSGLTNLEHLRVDANSITDVQPLTSLVNLERLWIAGNSLANAHLLSSLTGLTYIDIPIPDPPDTTAPRVSISAPSGMQNGAFSVTITFTETVSGFVGSDVSLSGSTASITSWRANSGNTVYTATITPTAIGTVTIGVAANVATDAANNSNTAATSKTVTVDVDRPTVTISVPSGIQTGTFSATITFSETISNFVQSDVSLTGSAASITAWSANAANTVYTATITPTASGTVTVSVDANVVTDAASNQNTAATSKTVTVRVDTDPPGVSISVPLGVQTGTDGTRTRSTSSVSVTVPSGRLETGTFDVTITFTEPVSGFEQADLSLTGTAAASITAWKTTDNTVYTPTITPSRSGIVTLGVLAGVATDAAGNPNTAATSKTVTVDVDRPTVSITVPPDVQNGAFDVTITFSEAVIGFVQSELSLSGTATAGITAWSANTANTVYTATITPTTSGMVTLKIAADVATDTANNPNTAAIEQSVTVDVDSPSVKLTLSASGQGGNNNRIDIQISFTEPVEGFEQTDLSVTTNGLTALESNVSGGEIPLPDGLGNIVTDEVEVEYPIVSITGWTPDPDKTTYTAYITTYTETKGQVIVRVDADVATDVAGNPNVAGEALTVDVDQPLFYFFADSVGPAGSAPTTNCQVISPVNFYPGHPGRLDVNQDDSIDEDDGAMVEAALGQSGDGIVNSRTDINCDDTVDEDDLALLNDTESPSVRIIVPTDAQPGAFKIKISFSEIVFDFDVTDISLADSTATATSTIISYSWNRSAITYRVEITPTTSGNVVINVPAAVATDALGNENTAATQKTVTVDTGIPSVSITTGSVGENGVFDIVITFSEAVSGFVQEDLHLSGSANPSITAWTATDDTVFTATITPASNGRVYCYVPANVATDADNNPNSASARYSRDANPPTVTVSVPTDEQPGAFDITFSFSEIVLDFEQTDVSLADSTADAEITDWTVVSHFLIQYGTRYEATITPTTSGTVVISVPAGVAIDLSGNGNTASASHSITVSLPGSRRAPASLSGIVLDPTVLKTLDPEVLEAHLDILRDGNDGSLKYLQAIALLESVLAEMRPEKTVLLANYPNPFNPETWIPYHLANDTDVQISIYDINGALVRQLDLGHQRAGYYTNRSRAAYWDGTNDFGERVATGIYFYQLQADNMSLLRKMLILK